MLGQITGMIDDVIAELHDHVASLHTTFRRGAVRFHRIDQRTRRLRQVERLRKRLVHFLNRDTETAARDLAMGYELLLDLGRYVDRNGKREALIAASLAVDLRVNADHFAALVKQRTAGIAGVHRNICLDERHVGVIGQRARFGTDDTGGDRVLEAVRGPNGKHRLTNAGLRRVAQPDRGEVLRIDANHRDVSLRIAA